MSDDVLDTIRARHALLPPERVHDGSMTVLAADVGELLRRLDAATAQFAAIRAAAEPLREWLDRVDGPARWPAEVNTRAVRELLAAIGEGG